MTRECPCSTKTQEVLENPSPPPSRFPSTLEMSLGLRPRDISRVSGNLSGVGDGFPNTSLVLLEHGYNLLQFSQNLVTWQHVPPQEKCTQPPFWGVDFCSVCKVRELYMDVNFFEFAIQSNNLTSGNGASVHTLSRWHCELLPPRWRSNPAVCTAPHTRAGPPP